MYSWSGFELPNDQARKSVGLHLIGQAALQVAIATAQAQSKQDTKVNSVILSDIRILWNVS